MRSDQQNTDHGIPRLLERAALHADRRSAVLARALKEMAGRIPAAGTALIRPSVDERARWRVEYAGARAAEVRRWILSRLSDSPGETAAALSERCPYLPGARAHVFPLHPQAAPSGGLWVVWPHKGLEAALQGESTELLRRALESFTEVEHRERLYFNAGGDLLDSELARALHDGDDQALPALLSFARLVSDADFTYWGSVHNDVVDVEWHLGARDSGFGFELPLGEGVGGRAFARSQPLHLPDYRNCQYRYPGVSDVTDREEVRSTLAIPVRGSEPQTGAVLYAVRRSVTPFSPAERALLLRLARGVEPVSGSWPASRHLFVSGKDYLRTAKSELRRILLSSNQVRDVESWLERLIRGPAVVADMRDHPYVLGNAGRFERLRLSAESGRRPQVIPLRSAGADGNHGRLYLWPSIDLPPEEWPDLLEDTVAACNVVLDRVEHAHDRLSHQRSYWLSSVMEMGTTPQSRREGNRLGLPIERGEVWAIAWQPEAPSGGDQTRLKMVAEDVVLDQLNSPLIFLDDDIGVCLLKGQERRKPSAVRDELLKHFGPAPLWLVHGAVYDSFENLNDALKQAIGAAQRVRRQNDGRYTVEIAGGGLDDLLENPKLSGELSKFAANLLGPLTNYDGDNNSRLTETLCLTLTLGSVEEAAKQLFVHTNTIRYRMRRAEQILGRDLNSPKDRTAVILASFIWLRHHDTPGRNP